MPDVSTASEIAPWLQAGGVVGFAGLVYIELRAHRAEMRLLRRYLVRATERLAVLLDRVRGGRAPTQPQGVPVVEDVERDDDEDGDDARP